MNIKEQLENNLDFIISPKYGNSLSSLLQDYPDGVPDKIICRVLRISQSDLDTLVESAIGKIKKVMNEVPTTN